MGKTLTLLISEESVLRAALLLPVLQTTDQRGNRDGFDGFGGFGGYGSSGHDGYIA